jgi:hypothetical protein
VLWFGAPDCPVCHRTVSGATEPYMSQAATLGKTQACSAIIHRTVRCATGLSRWVSEQRLSSATVDSDSATVSNSAAQKSEQRSQSGTRLSGAARGQSPQRSTGLQTLMIGWHGGAPDSLQCLSDGAPDCPVCPSTAASPTATLVVEGYKYPQPPPLLASKISEYHIQSRALALTPRHNSKDQSLSKSQVHLKQLVTCEREILCSFELLLLGLPFFFSFSYSQVLCKWGKRH